MRIICILITSVVLSLIILPICMACNQKLYDRIYEEISKQAMRYDHRDKKAELRAMDLRYNTIQNLRDLCNGQLSSYEKGEKVK